MDAPCTYGIADGISAARNGLECVSKMPEAHFRAIRLHFCVEKP
jgi:hypothetical protein